MYPHRIRLRGPWECVPTGPGAPPPRRVTMPRSWQELELGDYHGPVRFVRKFGYPGKADPQIEHIWLSCSGVGGCRSIHLNAQLIAESPTPNFESDVTPLLSARNEIEIHVDAAVRLWDEVVLEIRRDAYLANVQIERDDSALHLRGVVIGSAPGPLELYTLVDNRNADYRTITPTPAGQAFHISMAGIDAAARAIRIELVHVSTVWFRVELPIPNWKSP